MTASNVARAAAQRGFVLPLASFSPSRQSLPFSCAHVAVPAHFFSRVGQIADLRHSGGAYLSGYEDFDEDGVSSVPAQGLGVTVVDDHALEVASGIRVLFWAFHQSSGRSKMPLRLFGEGWSNSYSRSDGGRSSVSTS